MHGTERTGLRHVRAITAWRPDFLCHAALIPRIVGADVVPLIAGMDLWDCWPLARTDGQTATLDGREMWFFLSAPRQWDAALRHGEARIRMLSVGADGWRDHGAALPDTLRRGSREWAGSAVLDDDGETVTLFFTAAGRRGEPDITFEQRIFAAQGRVQGGVIADWQVPVELIRADGFRYAVANEAEEPAPGMLKAFRDPFHFRDPATGTDHLVFTASAGWADDRHRGVIGLATRYGPHWVLDDPLIDAVGVNNELERPQLMVRAGTYYLLWSTQAHTFSPRAAAGPTGLYGMFAPALRGPWRPLNGSGLVAANPPGARSQSYSWSITGTDEVWSFIDRHEAAPPFAGQGPQSVPFAGTLAPAFQLRFEGDRVQIVSDRTLRPDPAAQSAR